MKRLQKVYLSAASMQAPCAFFSRPPRGGISARRLHALPICTVPAGIKKGARSGRGVVDRLRSARSLSVAVLRPSVDQGYPSAPVRRRPCAALPGVVPQRAAAQPLTARLLHTEFG